VVAEDTTSASVAGAEDIGGPTVGVKEQLGVGVIALGLFALLTPWASTAIADTVKGSNAYSILAGSVLVLGLFILAAGIAIIVQKFD
jgi:hypothetical protein